MPAAPTPPATQELLYLRKNLDFAAPGGDWESILRSKATDEEKVTAIKAWVKQHLQTDLDASPHYRPDGLANHWGDGWRVWHRWDLPPERIRQELPGWGLIHKVSGNLPEFVSSILDGGGQITPTMERLRIGVSLSTGGWSTEIDQNTGGANYFFTRIADPARVASHCGMVFKIELLARTDAFSFRRDVFGDVRPPGENTHIRNIALTDDPRQARGRTLTDYKNYARFDENETLFKNGMSLLDDIDHIRTSSPAERAAVLQVFARHGITHLPDGRKVEDIVK